MMQQAQATALKYFLLSLPLCLLLPAQIGFVTGIPVSIWHFPLGVALALIIAVATVPGSYERLTSATLCLAVLASSLWISSSFIEISYDGRAYHSPVSYALADGWNPLQIPSLCDWQTVFCEHTALVYMDHYPKAQWVIASTIYQFTGSIEAGNVMNLLLMVLVLVLANQVLTNVDGLTRGWRHTLALLIALNPVTISQLYTSYVDGLVASLLSVFTLSLIDYLYKPKIRSVVPALLVIPYLINIKFSALAYCVSLAACFVLGYVYFHRRVPTTLIASGLATGALSIVFLGVNPYLQNVQQDNHIFYPVYLNSGAKSNTVDRQADAQFIARNRVSKFFIANFSMEKKGVDEWIPEFKLPFSYLKPQRSADPRFSGFGPLFGITLAFSCLQLLFIRSRILLASILSVIVSVFLTDVGWWARLAPQAWLAICLIQAAHLSQQRKAWTVLARTLSVLLMINSLLVLNYVTGKYVEKTRDFQEQIAQAAQGNIPIMLPDDELYHFNKRRLADTGLPLRLVQSCNETQSNALFILCAEEYEEM